MHMEAELGWFDSGMNIRTAPLSFLYLLKWHTMQVLKRILGISSDLVKKNEHSIYNILFKSSSINGPNKRMLMEEWRVIRVCTHCAWNEGTSCFGAGVTGPFSLSNVAQAKVSVHPQHIIKGQDSGTILMPSLLLQWEGDSQSSFIIFQLICQENWKVTDKTFPLLWFLHLSKLQAMSAACLQEDRKMRRSLPRWVWGDTYHRHYFCRCCRALSPAGSGMLISSSSQLLRELLSPDKDLLQRLNCESHLLRNYMCCGKGRRKRGRSEIITYTSH